MGEGFESKSDREQVITVQIQDGKAYKVYKESDYITSMIYADAFIILPIEKSKVKEGEHVRVILLNV